MTTPLKKTSAFPVQQSPYLLLLPQSKGLAHLASLAGEDVLHVLVQIFDPCDLHRYYPATFDIVPSKNQEQCRGPCPLTKAVIPYSICDHPGACPTLSIQESPQQSLPGPAPTPDLGLLHV
jgi:hypothetical protein